MMRLIGSVGADHTPTPTWDIDHHGIKHALDAREDTAWLGRNPDPLDPHIKAIGDGARHLAHQGDA